VVPPATYPYSATGEPPFNKETQWFDPLISLAYIAGVTTRLKLATAVYLLPLRHPITIAREVASLDQLSEGRLILGVGTGWLRQEFEAVDQDFDNRGKRMDEIVGVMKKLWTEETIVHQGEYYSFGPIPFEPKPVHKPHTPLHFGGETPVALRRAARLGDGWLAMAHSPESAGDAIRKIGDMRAEYGRSDIPFEVTVQCPEAPSLDDARRFEEAGVDRIRTFPWRRGRDIKFEEIIGGLERFAESVVNKI
ncbi:LLM class F420-dependent oxidoreductase, partial [Dehalococcoidia bacterium]|nr:LLM class F420-dependent oxidoreductase [Dehalococcoidia bacterium]